MDARSATAAYRLLAGARVTIDGQGVHESSTTDAAGRHVFAGLQPGEYTIGGSLEGYVSTGNLRPVKVHCQGLCGGHRCGLQLDRLVSGLIVGKDGQPAVGSDGRSGTYKATIRQRSALGGRFRHNGWSGAIELRHLHAATTILESPSAARRP